MRATKVVRQHGTRKTAPEVDIIDLRPSTSISSSDRKSEPYADVISIRRRATLRPATRRCRDVTAHDYFYFRVDRKLLVSAGVRKIVERPEVGVVCRRHQHSTAGDSSAGDAAVSYRHRA